VFPGERVLTNFTLTDAGAWLIEISVLPQHQRKQHQSEKGKPKGSSSIVGRGPTLSRVVSTYPYANRTLSWLDPAFNTTRVGCCAEVYNLDTRGQYPSSIIMNVTASAPLSMSTPFVPWGFVEKPTCAYSPLQSSVHGHVDHKREDLPVVQTIRFELA
jgi:hypothetical protein